MIAVRPRQLLRTRYVAPDGDEDREEDRPQDKAKNPQRKHSADRSKHDRRDRDIARCANGQRTYRVIGQDHEKNTPDRQE